MKKFLLIGSLSALALAGCASDSSIAKKTAFSMGLDQSQVQVSQVDIGFAETTYIAHINGAKHNCTALGGGFFAFGQVFSPNCIRTGGGSAKKNNSCNPMLKAAGKCK